MNSLFNKYEGYTQKATDLDNEFRKLVHSFIEEKCEEYSTIEVEAILTSVVSTKCTFERAKKALVKRIYNKDL